MVSILFLAADPTDAFRLRIGEEAREIQEQLRLSTERNNFKFHHLTSVRPADISRALLDIKPQIVHFSGHGTDMGEIWVEDTTGHVHAIQPDALANLFEQFNADVDCVILNACYSELQAHAIAKHIRYVIGMNQAIDDQAAIAFSIGFYQAIGARRSVEQAYKLGCIQMELQGFSEQIPPVLINPIKPPVVKKTINSSDISSLEQSYLRVQIILHGDFKGFDKAHRYALITTLAALLNIDPVEILLLNAQPGSIILDLQFPEKSANSLYDLACDRDSQLINLGIKSVAVENREIINLVDMSKSSRNPVRYPLQSQFAKSLMHSFQSFKSQIVSNLSHPMWQGIGAIVGMFALIAAIIGINPIFFPLSSITITPIATNTLKMTITPTVTNTLKTTTSPTATKIPTTTITPTATKIPTTTITPTVLPCTKIGDSWVSPIDGMKLLCVPAGAFQMGSNNGDEDERPSITVILDPYWIDETEVTNRQFANFVQQTGYITDAEKRGSSWLYSLTAKDAFETNGITWKNPKRVNSSTIGREDHPVVHVSWNDANQYCLWAGRKLPTEAQWEKAARGINGQTYPWGNEISESASNTLNFNLLFKDTTKVGSFIAGQSPYKVQDMAGNVWEWVSDWYKEDYYKLSSGSSNPTGPISDPQKRKVMRGGSWVEDKWIIRSSNRYNDSSTKSVDDLGFRCVQ